MKWERVGSVSIDGKHIWLGDPKRFAEPPRYTSGEVHEVRALYAAKALLVRCADGSYPVFVQRDEDGRIVSVRVDLTPEEEA